MPRGAFAGRTALGACLRYTIKGMNIHAMRAVCVGGHMRVLAIIPAYNEEVCLAGTVSGLVRTCPDIDYLVVNDGSRDNTDAICVEGGFPHVTLPINTGLASGFQTGMKYALRHGYDAAVQNDADGQHLPETLPVMIEAMERERADIVIGSRALAGESEPEGLRGVGSRFIAGIMRLTTGTRITDPTSGLRLYSLRAIEVFAKAFDLAPEPDAVALLARKGYKVVEVPARMQERQGGVSYLNAGNAIRYMARTSVSILLFQWFR